MAKILRRQCCRLCYFTYPRKTGGAWACGYTNSNDGVFNSSHGGSDAWVAHLDDTGALSWIKTYGGSYFDGFYAIYACTNNGMIAAGSTFSSDGQVTGLHGAAGSNGDVWVTRLNDTGAIQWANCYGGTNYEGANCIQQTADSGFFVSGYSGSIDGDATACNGGVDYWCFKLSSGGSLQWQRSMGGSQNESAYCGFVTADGGYALAGYTQSQDYDVTLNHGGYDYWVVKLSFTASTPTLATLSTQINVFPNPASGLVHINLPEALADATLSLSNVLGQLLYSNTQNNTSRCIDISTLPEGLYVLSIKNQLGQLSSKIICAH